MMHIRIISSLNSSGTSRCWRAGTAETVTQTIDDLSDSRRGPFEGSVCRSARQPRVLFLLAPRAVCLNRPCFDYAVRDA